MVSALIYLWLETILACMMRVVFNSMMPLSLNQISLIILGVLVVFYRAMRQFHLARLEHGNSRSEESYLRRFRAKEEWDYFKVSLRRIPIHLYLRILFLTLMIWFSLHKIGSHEMSKISGSLFVLWIAWSIYKLAQFQMETKFARIALKRVTGECSVHSLQQLTEQWGEQE